MAEIINIFRSKQTDAYEILLVTLEHQLRVGLGLEDSDDEENIPLFEFVQNIYDQANEGCFFCDSRIDPNDPDEYPAKLCIMCQYKLGRLLENGKNNI